MKFIIVVLNIVYVALAYTLAAKIMYSRIKIKNVGFKWSVTILTFVLYWILVIPSFLWFIIRARHNI